MKKRFLSAAVIVGVLTSFVAFPAFAGTWKTGAEPNHTRYWYDNGDGTWPAGSWKWIDGDNNGIAECYYFDAEGWLVTDGITPDHYQVDASGAWIVEGVVQTRPADTPQGPSQDQTERASGWVEEESGWRFYKGGQFLSSQWRNISGKRYYFDDSGFMVTGFQEIDGNSYYFTSSGALKTKNFTLNDVRYIVEEDGMIVDEYDGGDWDSFQSDDDSSSGGSSSGSSSSKSSPSGSSSSKGSSSGSSSSGSGPSDESDNSGSSGDKKPEGGSSIREEPDADYVHSSVSR